MSNLDYDAEVTVWKHAFNLSKDTMDDLMEAARTNDFAILVLTPDDVAKVRGEAHTTARDNVIFELGLFIGSLGRERTFFITPRGSDLKLPSDLAGVKPGTYRTDRADQKIIAALNACCTEIRQEIERLA
ncbi:MAG: nucleotide-binding protein [Armatimonadetes bacterium]|nr:nucleotide-binding protein [Armatimonadota bacterium]